MDRMAILIGNDPGASAIVPMLEREGLRVEITRSPEQALERLRQLVDRGGVSSGEPGEAGGNGSRYTEEGGEPWERGGARPYASAGGQAAGGAATGLDQRLAAVQERARALEGEEQQIINDALQQASGNKTAAARLLGISRYALQRRLRRFAKPQNPPPPDQ